MKNLAQAYALKRRSKLKLRPEPELIEAVDDGPIEEWPELPEETEPIAAKGIDIAAIIKKHKFFAGKNDD